MCDKFSEVYHALNVGSIELSDVVKFGDRKLFCANVKDEKRTEPLMLTGILRSMKAFENLYIQKDLTYENECSGW